MIVLDLFGEPTVLANNLKYMAITSAAIIPGFVYTVKRYRIRKRLDRRLPCKRLRMNGVTYVH